MLRVFRSGLRAWFDLPLMTKGMIAISIPVVCILFSILGLHVLQRQRSDLTQWIGRAFQAGSRIQAVATLLADAESATRAFLLTGDEKRLEPYHKARRELSQRIARLRESVGDSPKQLKRVERVEFLSQQRLAALESQISRAGSRVSADQLDLDRSLTDSIQQEFAAMRAEESGLWVSRIAAETTLRRRLSTAMYAAAMFSLLAGSLAMALFVTGIVRRSQLLRANADRLARGEALADLPPGADEIGRLGEALARSSRLLAEHEGELQKLNQELDRRVQERTAQLEQETAEHRRSEEQLRQAQKMEAIGRLAGGVAHDFNNVLTIITGYSQLLRDSLRSDPYALARLSEIVRSAEHAASLTRQLLAFSRRQVIQPKLVDLNAVVTRVDQLLRRLIGEDIELRTRLGAGLEQVRVDEGQMEQVIMNLVVNARDAMPTGGKLTIETGQVELDEAYCRLHLNCMPGRYVMLAVSDSGQGMTEDVQARIFEPFFTTKDRGKGTGLGLSTVYGIVRSCGGAVWVYSQVGMGTTFKVYLPAVSAGEEPATAAPGPCVEAKRSGTILLVEDDAAVRRMTKEILRSRGYTVLEADSADSARRLCQEHAEPIELLLTDVVMPDTNGRRLAEELQLVRPSMKVLYMSGYTDEAIAEHGVLDVGVAFIEKPFTPDSLSAKVREVVGPGETLISSQAATQRAE